MLKTSLLHISQVLTSKLSMVTGVWDCHQSDTNSCGRRQKQEYGYSNSLNPGNFEEFCLELTSSNSHHRQRRSLGQLRIAPKEATTEKKKKKTHSSVDSSYSNIQRQRRLSKIGSSHVIFIDIVLDQLISGLFDQ